MKKRIALLLALAIALTLTACGAANRQDSVQTPGAETETTPTQAETPTQEAAQAPAGGIDYRVLVNRYTPLPEGWTDGLETVTMTNSVGDDIIEVERRTYDAYLRLKEALAQEGVYIDLDTALRSMAAQQEVMDRYTMRYGAGFAAKTVAPAGYSEHHTGLALDLYLNVDGRDIYYIEEMVQYPDLWADIHEKLADYGFILRYPQGKEHITGYGYAPWHIRYIDDVDAANTIMSQGLTLEEYLGAASSDDVDIDYGDSSLYTPEELAEAVVQVKCRFAAWAGCTLHSIRYAGDEANSQENLQWLNDIGGGAQPYVRCAAFLLDFHTAADIQGAWEPDMEYTDYQFWLACTQDGGWEIVSFGY